MNDFPERPKLWEPSTAYVRAANLVENFASDCERVWSFSMDQTMRQRLHMLVLDALETPFRGREPAATADPIGRASSEPWEDGATPLTEDVINRRWVQDKVAEAVAASDREEKQAKKARKKRGRPRKAKAAKAKAAESQPEGEAAS